MAHYKMDHPDAARSAFRKGVEIIERNLPKLESGDIGGYWVDRVFAHVLRREASLLIEGKVTPDPFNR